MVERQAVEVVLPGLVEPDGLQLRTRELPAPGPGEALVAMEATGVSFAEQQMRRGKYYDQPPFPFVPGYDLVGTVVEVGTEADRSLVGTRVAALTKTGGWATLSVQQVADLVPVPAGIDPAAAETVVVNGITAWQLLHRHARVARGATVVVLGANGGVGSTLTQLAVAAGIRVIGTASARNLDAVRSLGAEPVDYADPDLYARLRALAPDGVDAVFDHVGGPAIVESFRLLRRGGVLASYGTAATKNDAGSSRLPVLALIGRLALWNLLPNGRRAFFYNLWSGVARRAAFRARLHADLGAVLTALDRGEITPQIAARVPLDEAARALALAESRTVVGKVIMVPRS